MVAFMSRKSKSKTEIAAPSVPGRAQLLVVFGPPPLLEGEDAAAYDQLLARIWAAVKPVDIIDEIFIDDVASLEWEVLRLRRLKWTLIRALALEMLKGFLLEQLDYDLYSEHFADDLAEILQDNLPKDKADSAQTMADECARDEAEAVDKVNEILDGIGLNMDKVLADAKGRKAKELVQEYVRREPDAVNLVHQLLTGAGMSMDAFMAPALRQKLDNIERIDRLTAIAETRRNAALREIDRRRAVLGETLRQTVQEIENDDFANGKLVPELPPAKGKNAA
jgi:hypothetical protein